MKKLFALLTASVFISPTYPAFIDITPKATDTYAEEKAFDQIVQGELADL